MLAKRVDSPQQLAGRRQLPIRAELVPVLGGPLDGETKGTGREPAIKDLKALDRDLDFELPVLGMEMGRVMIIEMHADDDPKEP